MLEIKNATLLFQEGTPYETRALDDFSLSLPKGDFVTLLGSNGAGKSTLFNVISGSYLLDKGEVLLDKADVTYLPEHKRSASIGRLFQDPLQGTAPNMTIEENMALAYLRSGKGFRPFSRVKKRDRDFFAHQLARLGLGLENRLDSAVGLLSGGQRQALTLLMATLVTPKVLLLDEHTAALDPATAEKILTLTKEIVEKSEITCLMITHNISSALSVGRRTMMMDRGRIVLDIEGDVRKNMTLEGVMKAFRENAKRALDDERILLA